MSQPESLTRTVSVQTAMSVLDIVSSGDWSMEGAMRHLFPEDAAKIYSPGRWPWGPPKETS